MMQIFNTSVVEKYDRKRDLLYLHAENANFMDAFGDEPEVGIIIFRNYKTKEFIGLTIMDCCTMTDKRSISLKHLGIDIDLHSLCGSVRN